MLLKIFSIVVRTCKECKKDFYTNTRTCRTCPDCVTPGCSKYPHILRAWTKEKMDQTMYEFKERIINGKDPTYEVVIK